jgi:hypothetical protein
MSTQVITVTELENKAFATHAQQELLHEHQA